MKLGVATIDSELSNTILHYSIENKNSITLVTEKKGIDKIDGLIIPIIDKAQLTIGIEWLLASQKNQKAFVWVFSRETLGEEEKILKQLGANEVVTREENIPSLFLSIKNIFARLEYTDTNQERYSKEFLNEQNQTVNVNGDDTALTRKEFIILERLFENEGSAVPYEVLMEHVWPDNPDQNMYRLANVVFHLRKKVRESQDFIISNISSKGYVLKKKEHD